MQPKLKQKLVLQKQSNRKLVHPLACMAFLFFIITPSFLRFVPKSPNTVLPQVLGAETIATAKTEKVEQNIPIPPTQILPLELEYINAKSFIVYDEFTKEVLTSKNINIEYPIASLTKLLTAWVVYRYLDWNSPVTISGKLKTVSPELHLQAGDQVWPADLFNSMLVGSANDAALELAQATQIQTGESFTYLMNSEAKKNGMEHSNFSNALGFDSNYNFATAEDVVKLIQTTQKSITFTEENRSTSYGFKALNGRQYKIRATNKLLVKYPDIMAIKTGFTGEARGAMAVKIQNKNHPFVVLVLQSEDREGDVLKLKSTIEKSYIWE